MSIYKSAYDKIVQTGIKAELEGKKKILSVSQFVMACNLYLCLSSLFSLFRRDEMFVRILTEWIITSSGSC